MSERYSVNVVGEFKCRPAQLIGPFCGIGGTVMAWTCRAECEQLDRMGYVLDVTKIKPHVERWFAHRPLPSCEDIAHVIARIAFKLARKDDQGKVRLTRVVTTVKGSEYGYAAFEWKA